MTHGLWACPNCGTVVATEDRTYPPGKPQSDDSIKGCAACSTRKIDPDRWERVSP